MRIFLYEHLTGGGALATGAEAAQSLVSEGLAMLRAIGSDLAQVPGVELCVLADERIPINEFPAAPSIVLDAAGWHSAFVTSVQAADGIMLIAPETGGVLHDLARQVENLGGRLLSPSAAFIEIAADKQRTADLLANVGVPTPYGALWHKGESPPEVTFPAILKPVDGCGSQDVQLLSSSSELPQWSGTWRLETYQPGLPASVAVLCGPNGRRIALPACSQRLTTEETFTYLGGETPLPLEWDARARRIALQAVAAIASAAPSLGYVGVDLVLGENSRGDNDVVIEVNPRLTTSYVGLRVACRENLAAAILQLSLGQTATVDFRPERIEFDASGAVRRFRPLGPQRLVTI
jgi:predicted ATP-grasp superfamily ATP-dependent carboligase